MYTTNEQIVISSLLHDVGKLYGRAEAGRINHSDSGAAYISEKTNNNNDWKVIIDGIRYHHEYAIKNAGLPGNHIAYIICEADNISAGLDRRVIEQDSSTMWDKSASLKSIFNIVDGKKKQEELSYDLKALKKNDSINIPKAEKEIIISQQRYKYLLNDFDTGIEQFIKEEMSVNSLLKLVELSFFSIPSSTDKSQQTDISLYHHSKTTAMLASAMYQYFSENKLEDYRETCLLQKEKFRDEEMFLMVAGDISGIQKFIYSVSSKGALKSLRGRSFYLEFLTEHIIDEILEKLNLSRANLIYSGGGSFYLLLPNTDEAKNLLNEANTLINNWLFEKFSTDLYIQISSTSVSANKLANSLSEKIKTKNELGEIYRQVGAKVSQGKLKRYGLSNLKKMMFDDLQMKDKESSRECSVCGREENLLTSQEETTCGLCNALFELGDSLPRIYHKEEAFFLAVENLSEAENKEGFPLPSLEKNKNLIFNFVKLFEAEELINFKPQTRFYSLNDDSYGYNFANNIWLASYNIKNEESAHGLIDLKTLANKSQGIKRIAMLKVDVDNLGSTFKNAFIDKNSVNPYQFLSISRNTSLSYFLSMFFKYEVNKVCENTENTFTLLLNKKEEKAPYNLVLIYSGGDDVLLVGSWDNVLEFAVNLNKVFKEYTINQMTLSAGFGIFSPSYPINQMAKITDSLEARAKESGKDAISLFTDSDEHTYKWDEFENDVIKDKFHSLYSWFDIDGNDDGYRKIPYPPTAFYRLMLFLSELSKEKSKINVAQIAYTIARMEPDKKRMESCGRAFEEFKSTFYQWILNPNDRKSLLTAMYLIIYLNRGE